MIKLITWNINSIRLRLPLLERLILEQKPDIIMLQEIKVDDGLFPVEAIQNFGYRYLHYSGQKSYNGVAILSKIEVHNAFTLKFCNDDKRHISVKLGDIEIHNFYIPAGGDIPDIDENPKFRRKLEYIKLMQEWFLTNRTSNDKIILAGDLNIAPYEHDVWSSKQLTNVISHTKIERTMFIDLQTKLGLIDSARHFIPLDQKFYTWWSYRNIDWQKSNRGRKLDHILVSKNLQNQLVSIRSLVDTRSWQQPSDHVPYMIELAK